MSQGDRCNAGDGQAPRLSRNVALIANLQESRAKFVCDDMSDANELTIHLFAAIAEHERKLI